jgi:hypothetical protein
MSWRTRHIRKRNKGKEKRGTKRNLQSGGASLEKLNNVIAHLVETKEDVSAKIDKLPVNIKFTTNNKFTGISGIEGIFSFTTQKGTLGLGGKIMITKNNASQKSQIAGKELIIDKLDEFEKTVTTNQTNKAIKEKADLQIKLNADKQAREAAVAANEMAISAAKQAKTEEDARNAGEAALKMIKDSYVVSIIDLKDVMQKETIKPSMFQSFQTQPYTESALKHLRFCVGKYLIGTITIDEINTFLVHFKESISHKSEEPTISEDDVKDKIQFAIDVVSSIKNMVGMIKYSSEKNELVDILKKLNIKKIEPSNKYSFDKECTEKNDICFFIKCIQFYDLKDSMLDSITSISDVITNGTVSGYDKLAFVSDKMEDKSYIGCVCYTETADVKISKILENDESTSEHKTEMSKLIDILKPILDSTHETMTIPSSLNEKVKKDMYESDSVDEEFTKWTLIPTSANVKDKVKFDAVKMAASALVKEILLKLSESMELKEETPSEETPSETPTEEVVKMPEQTGGKINIDLQKHEELKEIYDIIESLPASLYKENEELINNTIKKVNDSNAKPDLAPFKEKMDKLTRNSTTIKEVLKTDTMKQILPDEAKEEEEFQKKAEETKEPDATADVESTSDANPETTPEITTDAQANLESTPETTTDAQANPDATSDATPETPSNTDASPDANPDSTPETTPETEEKETPSSGDMELTTETPAISESTASEVKRPITSAPTTSEEVTPSTSAPATSEAEPTSTNSESIVPATSDKDEPLTLEDLKISPSMKNKQSNEMGKYIFVPDNRVQLVIDYLLSNGCEITTTVIK